MKLNYKKCIMILVTIGLVLILISLPGFTYLLFSYGEECRRKDAGAYAGVKTIVIAIEEYKKNNGDYPKNLSVLVPKYIEAMPINPWIEKNFIDKQLMKHDSDYYYSHPDVFSRNKSGYAISFYVSQGECKYHNWKNNPPKNISLDCYEYDITL